jgi:superoxide dismutase
VESRAEEREYIWIDFRGQGDKKLNGVIKNSISEKLSSVRETRSGSIQYDRIGRMGRCWAWLAGRGCDGSRGPLLPNEHVAVDRT